MGVAAALRLEGAAATQRLRHGEAPKQPRQGGSRWSAETMVTLTDVGYAVRDDDVGAPLASACDATAARSPRSPRSRVTWGTASASQQPQRQRPAGEVKMVAPRAGEAVEGGGARP